MTTAIEFDLEFDRIDQIDQEEAEHLQRELEATGAHTTITSTHPGLGVLPLVPLVAVIAVSTGSMVSLAVTVTFIYAVMRRGVIADLTGRRPAIRKSRDLPRGSVLILYKDGRQELRDGLTPQGASELIKAALESMTSIASGGTDRGAQGTTAK